MNPAGGSLADDGRTMLRDGRPIPLIVDTAWSGVIRATDADWQRYLHRRREQGFTTITFVATHWRDAPVDGAMSLACWIARWYADLPSIMLVGGDARYARNIPRWRQIGGVIVQSVSIASM
jgi:hypothetical protein